MSRWFPEEWLAELKSKVSIVDVAEEVTEVRRTGSTGYYMVSCPFPGHQDRSPSLMLKPDSNTFSCFGCGAGSKNHHLVQYPDVISFVQHTKNMSFPDTAIYLAEQVGLPLPPMNAQQQKQQNEYQKYLDYCQHLANKYKQSLYQNETVRRYLGGRAFEDIDLATWELGYCEGEPDQPFHNVKNRITFPIYDMNGHIVSFSGRVAITGEQLTLINERRKETFKDPIPKYKHQYNFDNGNHLYGIHLAKEHIRKNKSAIIVEGFTDVIRLHKHGANHAVSTMGVALTDAQIRLLKRAGAEKAILMRDGDTAGILASERDAAKLKEHGIKSYIVPLKDGIDPDDLCFHYGYFNEGLSRFINKTMVSVEQYKVNKVYTDVQEEILYHYSQAGMLKSDAIKRIIDVLVTIDDPIQLDILIRQVAELSDVDYDSIKQAIRQKRKELQEIELKKKKNTNGSSNVQTNQNNSKQVGQDAFGNNTSVKNDAFANVV